jgi:hypothetical protein
LLSLDREERESEEESARFRNIPYHRCCCHFDEERSAKERMQEEQLAATAPYSSSTGKCKERERLLKGRAAGREC